MTATVALVVAIIALILIALQIGFLRMKVFNYGDRWRPVRRI